MNGISPSICSNVRAHLFQMIQSVRAVLLFAGLLCTSTSIAQEQVTPLHADGWRAIGKSMQERSAFNRRQQPQVNKSESPREIESGGDLAYSTAQEQTDDWILDRDVWDGSISMGTDGTRGNSETERIHGQVELERLTRCGLLELELDYIRSDANDQLTKHHALFELSHQWTREDSPTSWFGEFGIEYDEFKAFDMRLKANGGIDRTLFKSERNTIISRFGAGVSKEVNGPDDRVVPEAVFGLDYAHSKDDFQTWQIQFEYFPDWTDFTEFRIEARVEWEVILDKDYGLSLKMLGIDRYDSTPINRKPNDLTYSILLSWKL